MFINLGQWGVKYIWWFGSRLMDQVENSGNEIVHINEWAVGPSDVWLLTRSTVPLYSPQFFVSISFENNSRGNGLMWSKAEKPRNSTVSAALHHFCVLLKQLKYRQEFSGRKSVKIQPSDILLILLHETHRILRKPKINKEKLDLRNKQRLEMFVFFPLQCVRVSLLSR